jgi:aspartate kinase
MRVMKFGGTSVGDPARVSTLCDIVRSALPLRPVVVVSAASKVTDMLLTAARTAAQGTVDDTPVVQRVTSLLQAFELPEALLRDELSGLRDALRAIAAGREASPALTDLVASYGERISVRFIAAVLRAHGVPAKAYDAFEVGMITDDQFGSADVTPEADALLAERITALALHGEVPVITGFIGKTRDGRVTTLGRGGSDYSAALIGAAIGADEIEIWTDVPGVMSADPRVVPEAHTIPSLSFDEAAELAYFGAKVLHPKTIHPAVRRGIPVRVKNTFDPSHPGTVITARGDLVARGVRAIAHKHGITVVHIVSTRMLLAHGFLARIFEVFARHRVVVDLVATSEVSVSCTVDRDDQLHAALDELRTIGDVTVTRNRTLVSVIVAGLLQDATVGPRIFSALGREDIPVELLSMGASAINVSMVLGEGQGERAVRALHRALFSETAS